MNLSELSKYIERRLFLQ